MENVQGYGRARRNPKGMKNNKENIAATRSRHSQTEQNSKAVVYWQQIYRSRAKRLTELTSKFSPALKIMFNFLTELFAFRMYCSKGTSMGQRKVQCPELVKLVPYTCRQVPAAVNFWMTSKLSEILYTASNTVRSKIMQTRRRQ